MIRVTHSLLIPLRHIKFVYGTSSGPGGQHVNRVATKATLLFNVVESPLLSTSQRDQILRKLATRISKIGVLRVSSSKYRSQKANRNASIERFAYLLQEVLKKKENRKKTTVSRTQRRKRLEQKKKQSEIKKMRSRVQPDKQ